MSKWIINNSGSDKYYLGREVADTASFEITQDRYPAYATNSKLIEDVGMGIVGMSHDGSNALSIADGIQLLVDVYPASKDLTIAQQPPFSSKKVGDKSLFTRYSGASFSVIMGDNDNLQFNVPYNSCKFNGLEIMGGTLGDYVSLKVLDTPTGTVSTVPNYMLNQFGFNVYVGEGLLYRRVSNYDADLIKDMKIVVDYHSTAIKTVYVNYMLHELK